MLLVYIDESGINYSSENNFFIDGPYIIYVGILISENKYFHTERMFYDLANELLEIKDWEKTELHANVLWKEALNDARSKKKVEKYFDELIQLICKLNLEIVVGIRQKQTNPTEISPEVITKEINLCIYSFLHGLEYKLAKLNQTAVLIGDSTSNELEKLIYDRIKWRYNPGSTKVSNIESKFIYESRSCFIVDQLHLADSKKSLFIQLVDHISFIFQRWFTYLYLLNFSKENRPTPDLEKVPVPELTFNLLVDRCNVSLNCFDENANDVLMSGPQSLFEDLLCKFTPLG